MSDMLERIYAAKARQLIEEQAREPYEEVRERALASVRERRRFLKSLETASGAAIICEIKRASPSAGLITRNFDPAAIARTYENAGANTISVLTERDHFLGELAFLQTVRAASSLPLLRKDFLCSRYQVAQSAAYGADCILLIVGALDEDALQQCLDEARQYDLDVLLEAHDEAELQRALATGGRLIGINNRSLRTLVTDLAVSEHLLPLIPSDVFGISESGMRDPGDVRRLRAAGARGFLIGEALMRADDPKALIASLRRALHTEPIVAR